MDLTSHQQEIYDHLCVFIGKPIDQNNISTFVCLLEGPAGVGKSYLMRKLVYHIRKELHLNVAGVAMTHKARKVLHHIINKRSIFVVPTMTIASLLNKARSHSYIGTNNYRSDGGNKIEQFDFLIIDEVSMVSDNDYVDIITFAMKRQKKILFIGDSHQIPHPTQRLNVKEFECEKADSLAFKLENQFHLTEIVRQQSNNSMIDYYMTIRDNLEDDTTFPPIENDNLKITAWKNTFEEWISNHYSRWNKKKINDISKDYPIYDCRIIAYTNSSVNYYNKLVRQTLGYPLHNMVVGEFLMGYANIGYPEHIIENGQDYMVKKIVHVKDYVVHAKSVFSGLVGNLVHIREVDNQISQYHQVFMPDIDDENNYDIIMELYLRAQKVNKKNSTKNDFRVYADLRYKMVFMENVFYFNGIIEKESSFKVTHPLLFTTTSEVMDENRDLYMTDKCRDIDDRYPDLRSQRQLDDKGLSETEHLADMFQILEKDLDYGYAITCHKSQGSSYQECFIDDTDFENIKDRWNAKHNMKESRIKEKNQLRYVAYTRAKQNVFALTKC